MNTSLLTVKKLFTLFFLLMSMSTFSHATPKHVLMVISGNGGNIASNKASTEESTEVVTNESNDHNGYEFDEFAKAYLVFEKNNIKVDIASPQGGYVKASEYNPNLHFNQSVLSNKVAMHSLEHSIALGNVIASKYNGVFVVGGNGAMFDLPDNIALQKIIRDIYQNNGSIAAVCHGPAALVNVKLTNGDYLVKNKKVNAFTLNEEKRLNDEVSKNFAFQLENQLTLRGAKFESSAMLMSHSVIDQRLITGQNQHSTGATAVNFLRSMGINNVTSPHFKDEASMALIKRYLAGDESALIEFSKQPQQYIPQLMGMYANGYARSATNTLATTKAVELMQAVMVHWQHPRLSLSLANNLTKLKRYLAAKQIIEGLLADDSAMAKSVHGKAKQLLSSIEVKMTEKLG